LMELQMGCSKHNKECHFVVIRQRHSDETVPLNLLFHTRLARCKT
jgi:hypothetical protein